MRQLVRLSDDGVLAWAKGLRDGHLAVALTDGIDFHSLRRIRIELERTSKEGA